MKTTKRCSGVNPTAAHYGDFLRNVLIFHLHLMRREFIKEYAVDLDNGELDCGFRFFSEYCAIRRIESAATEAEVFGNEAEWVWAALLDCASADAHYGLYKDWGSDRQKERTEKD